MSVLYFSVLFLHLQSVWFCSESRRKGRGIRVVYVCSVACFQSAKTLGSQQRSWLLHVWLVVRCGEEPCRLRVKKSSATETQPACILPFCLAAVSCHPLELSQNPSRIADLRVLLLGNWVLVKSSCDSAEELWPLCKAAIYSAANMQCRLFSAVLPTGGKGRPLQQAGLHPVSLRECAIRELITVENIPVYPFPLLLLLLCIREENRTSSNVLSLPGLVLHSN